MIDIHFHCLPGIDDGPATWTEAVDLCKAAASDGVRTIVATPHVLRDRWVNEDTAARDELVAELNRRLDGEPTVVPGCEFYFSADAVELWEKGVRGPLVGLNRSHYLLMEFPSSRIPERAQAVVHEFTVAGIRPIIAHPERNTMLARNPEMVRRFVDLGAATQITAASILGELGPAIQRTCDELFHLDLVHFVASDAHSLDRRPPRLSAARRRVRERWGAEAEAQLFERHPAALMQDKPLSEA